jgi:hypothetical protein
MTSEPLTELPGRPDPKWPQTDPRWPHIRFAPDPIQCLVQIHQAAADLPCECYVTGRSTEDDDVDVYEVECPGCRIRHTALYSTPAVYAALEPTLPKPEPVEGLSEEPPF